MKVAVVGTGHLAEATAACCGKWFELVDETDADLTWFCVDTPVNDHDESDVEFVMERLRWTLDNTQFQTPVLISSQVPVGFCAKMEAEYPLHTLAIQPENIRKAHAEFDFWAQNRIIIGTRHDEAYDLIHSVVSKFCPDPEGIIFMSPESAEMVKHTLNAFLAMEITFANDMADLCEKVGADAVDVFRGFRSDRRVGNGPLKPAGPYRGGTLGRDIRTLIDLGAGPLIEAVLESNWRRL